MQAAQEAAGPLVDRDILKCKNPRIIFWKTNTLFQIKEQKTPAVLVDLLEVSTHLTPEYHYVPSWERMDEWAME